MASSPCRNKAVCLVFLLWLGLIHPGSGLASQKQQSQSSQRPTIFPNSQSTTPDDIATLMRQTGQKNPSLAAIGVPKQQSQQACFGCQHGYPQAFAMDPLFNGRINSGLLKLTCPHLVRTVDALEDEGLMEAWNEDIRLEEDTTTLNSLLTERHAVHAQVRQDMVQADASSEELEATLKSKLGDKGMQAFLEAGVAGASPGSKDVKCLHAWLADALFFGSTDCNSSGGHVIGDRIVQTLQSQSISLSGTADCHQFCNPNASIALADPPKPRNKQRLRTSKEVERRKRRKREQEENKEESSTS